jgi:hypothetical protein
LNTALDCYSQSPIDKLTLLKVLQEQFDLRIEFTETGVEHNPTGSKSNYFSLNKSAAGLGYEPQYSSLSGILMEMNLLKSGSRHF